MTSWGCQRLLIVGRASSSILGTGRVPGQAGRKEKAHSGSPDWGSGRPWAVVVGTSVQWSEGALGKMCLKILWFPLQVTVTQPPDAHLKHRGKSIPTDRSRKRGSNRGVWKSLLYTNGIVQRWRPLRSMGRRDQGKAGRWGDAWNESPSSGP